MTPQLNIHEAPSRDEHGHPVWRVMIWDAETGNCIRMSQKEHVDPYDAAIYAARWAIKKNLPVSELVDEHLISVEALRR